VPCSFSVCASTGDEELSIFMADAPSDKLSITGGKY